jgi:hypothetical protein
MSDFPACQITGGYICFIITPNMLENLEKTHSRGPFAHRCFKHPLGKYSVLKYPDIFCGFQSATDGVWFHRETTAGLQECHRSNMGKPPAKMAI